MPHDLTLTTPDGVDLEAELALPDGADRIAVLTHPHPTYGGDMHNLVPATLFAALPSAGIGALRFNFRGTGASTGTHDDGKAEQLDVIAAISHAAALDGVTSVVGVGYSFGADVLLAVDDQRLRRVIVVAPPLRLLPDATLLAPRVRTTTTMLCPEHDQFRPAADAAEHVAAWPATTVEAVPGADHFLMGRGSWIAERVCALLDQ